MSRDKILVDSLYELFADRAIKDCLDINKAIQLVVHEDINGRACLKDETLESSNSIFGFLIENPGKKQIHLLTLDHCFFEDHEGPRCDCLVFDDNCLCFVELKLNVKVRRRATEELQSARRQLGSTIQFLRAATQPKSKNLFNFTLEAYIVMQTSVYPRKRASRDIVFVKFLEDFGVTLYEENSKAF